MSRFASFNVLAKQELSEAADYYEAEAAGLGARFVNGVESTVADLLEYPHSAPVIRGTIRARPLRHFPYRLLYRAFEDEIRILAVMHQKRRPFYWVGRS